MITTEFGREPGSNVPIKPKKYAGTEHPVDPIKSLVDTYIDNEQWTQGTNVLLRGDYGSHKTTTGLYVLRRIAMTGDERVQTYWTEADYLADLRELWSLREQLPKGGNDSDLWQEFVAWESRFEALKASPLLFLDNVGFGYTANHRYEILLLVRQRVDLGLPTIVAVSTQEWEPMNGAMKSLLERSSLSIRVGG